MKTFSFIGALLYFINYNLAYITVDMRLYMNKD